MAKERTIQVTVRVDESWLVYLDAIAKAFSRPGIEVTRVDAMRAALASGMVELLDGLAKQAGQARERAAFEAMMAKLGKK